MDFPLSVFNPYSIYIENILKLALSELILNG